MQQELAITVSNAFGPRVKPWFLLGVVLFVLGPVVYVVQFRFKYLTTPWYLPILATVGVAMMVYSVWRRRGIVRSLATVVCALVCGLQWFLILDVAKTPVYAGPIRTGQEFPDFTTVVADGRPFSQHDIQDGTATLMVFFRGRW